MGLFNIPDPVSIFENAKNSGLEREEINALVSCGYSALIALLWSSANSRCVSWLGLTQALKDQATAIYLSLHQLEGKNFLTLTVPKDLLDPDNLARFTTEQIKK